MQHEQHPVLFNVVAPFSVATTLFAEALRHLAASGLTWSTAAALLGGLGSCAIGLSGVSREVRAWRHGRPKGD